MSILDRFKRKKIEKAGAKEKSEKKAKVEKEKRVGKEKKEEKVKARLDSAAFRILIRPVISEKATNLAAENKYVFIVSRKATKKEIKQSIKDVYGIRPESVRVINVLGKKRIYGRAQGKTANFKKAIVKLPPGKTIQIYEGV